MDAEQLKSENERLRKQLAQEQLHNRRLQQQYESLSEQRKVVSQHFHSLSQQYQSVQKQHKAEISQFTKELKQKQHSIAQLEHQIHLLLQKIRGSRQERIDPDQLTLFSLEELQEIHDQLQQGDPEDPLIDTDVSKGKRRRRRRGKLPANLPREVQRHELDEQARACPCCGEMRQEIGVESSEQLEYIPAQMKILQHDRVKYACKHCQNNGVSGQVDIGNKPPQPIEKGLPGPGLCSFITLTKFGDHQPLYRIEDVTSRFGFTIRRSTLCQWQGALSELSWPLVARMKHLLLQSKVIHTDDTSIKMLEGGPARTAKFWPYLAVPGRLRPSLYRVRLYGDTRT